jgi:hypothetical protein
MDYVGLTGGWTGEMDIRALGRSGIAAVLAAYDIYGGASVYPPDLPERLRALDVSLAAKETGQLTLKITMIGGPGVAVSATPVPITEAPA